MFDPFLCAPIKAPDLVDVPVLVCQKTSHPTWINPESLLLKSTLYRQTQAALPGSAARLLKRLHILLAPATSAPATGGFIAGAFAPAEPREMSEPRRLTAAEQSKFRLVCRR